MLCAGLELIVGGAGLNDLDISFGLEGSKQMIKHNLIWNIELSWI